jgi:hypothetical protein
MYHLPRKTDFNNQVSLFPDPAEAILVVLLPRQSVRCIRHPSGRRTCLAAMWNNPVIITALRGTNAWIAERLSPLLVLNQYTKGMIIFDRDL